jgi:hypothetical protein
MYQNKFNHNRKKHQKSSGSSVTSSKKTPVTNAAVTKAPVPKTPVAPKKSKVVKNVAPKKALLPTPHETALATATDVREEPV